MKLLLSYLCGVIFSFGIIISGMISPAKVMNFFDFTGTWDPSLAFTISSALIVAAIGYRLVFRRATPLLGSKFVIPAKSNIDRSLVAGAGIFGVGWGLVGFCPGAALPALGTARIEALVFVVALIIGILAGRAFKTITLNRFSRKPA